MKIARRLCLAGLGGSLVAGPALAQIQVGRSYDDIVADGHIRIAFYRDFPPYAFEQNGRWRGIDVDLAEAIGVDMGVTVSYMPINADESVDDDLRNAVWKGHYLGGGVANVMLHVPVDKRLQISTDPNNPRNDLVVLFGAYHVEEISVAVDNQRLPEGSTLANFRFEPIGVELDSIGDFFLSSALGGSIQPQLRRYRNPLDAVEALRAGELAAVMGLRSQLEYGLRDAGDRFSLRTFNLPGLYQREWEIGAAVRENYRMLGYEVGDIISAIGQDGRMAEIFARYGVTWRKPPYM